jgi:hypothetical protein
LSLISAGQLRLKSEDRMDYTQSTNRFDHLESYFKKYSDIPKEAITKEDMLREGFYITRAALEFDPRTKTYQLFSWDLTKIEEMDNPLATVKFPHDFYIQGGIYDLKRTRLRSRLREDSPYKIDVADGKLAVLDRTTGHAIAQVGTLIPEPKCFAKTFEDGTPYREVGSPDLDFIVFRQCQYWGVHEECKYCDINNNAKAKLRQGQVKSIAPKKVDQVAQFTKEVLAEAEEFPPEWRPTYIHINGGSITKKVEGLDEVEFYLRYVDAIREKVGARLPIKLQTTPWPKEVEKEVAKRGNMSRFSNFEVWDPNLFAIICPGKNEYVGRDEWIKRILDQVDIFGEGHVAPGFVAGIEMAKPWGFKTVEEAVKSTTEGIEFMMSHGVVPRPISWCVEALSQLGGQEPPQLDYFIRLDLNWFETWAKYGLPPVVGLGDVGPGLNRYASTAAYDIGYYRNK